MYISLNKVSDFVHENFENVTVSANGTHWNMRCILCGDSKKSKRKKRFNLNYNNGKPIFQCFNCGETGSFISLYATIKGITIEEAFKDIKEYDFDKIKERLSKKEKKELNEEEIIYNKIFYNSIGINDKVDGYLEKQYQNLLKSFYENRKIPKDIDLRISLEGNFDKRILIPVIEDGNVIYIQGRSVSNDNPNKYYNPPYSKKRIILNINKFDKSKDIIITEGLLDAYFIGNQGTSCLGKSIKDDLISDLISLTNKKIIIAMDNDNDGIISTKKILNSSRFNKIIKYFFMPDKYSKAKDINDLITIYKVERKDVFNIIKENSYGYIKANMIINSLIKKRKIM